MSLPPSVVKLLKLPWDNVVRGTLADGSTTLLTIYRANIVWDKRVRPILVVESDSDALVGMKLLEGFELKVQVRSSGKVTIKRLR